VNVTNVVALTTGALTTGNMINLYQGTSAFSGYGLQMNFGGDGGGFTGQFIRCLKNGASRFIVYESGKADLRAIEINPVAVDGNEVVVTSSIKTSGSRINLYQGTSSFSGYGLMMNLGGGGSFTGQFLRCEKGGSARFAVYQDGAVYSYDGIATKVKAGAIGDGDFTTVQDGKIAIDSTNGRIYFRYNTGWHYVAQTAGFQIRAEDRTCSLCGGEIGTGEPVVGITGRVLEDGALHGEWVHLRCAVGSDRGIISAG
jgi:hypothetical protein